MKDKTCYTEVEQAYDDEHFAPGCYVDQSAGHVEILNKRIIRFAEKFGFASRNTPFDIADDYNELADQAVEYLNQLELRSGFSWMIDDNSLFLVGKNPDALQQPIQIKNI